VDPVSTWRITAAALALAVTCSQASPGVSANLFASAEQARELCKTSKDWCAGFVTGALDGWAALEAYYSGNKFCLPPDLTSGEVVEILALQLGQQTEGLTEPASYVLYEKLIEIFPCEAAR
jgi:hypothetical protein